MAEHIDPAELGRHLYPLAGTQLRPRPAPPSRYVETSSSSSSINSSAARSTYSISDEDCGAHEDGNFDVSTSINVHYDEASVRSSSSSSSSSHRHRRSNSTSSSRRRRSNSISSSRRRSNSINSINSTSSAEHGTQHGITGHGMDLSIGGGGGGGRSSGNSRALALSDLEQRPSCGDEGGAVHADHEALSLSVLSASSLAYVERDQATSSVGGQDDEEEDGEVDTVVGKVLGLLEQGQEARERILLSVAEKARQLAQEAQDEFNKAQREKEITTSKLKAALGILTQRLSTSEKDRRSYRLDQRRLRAMLDAEQRDHSLTVQAFAVRNTEVRDKLERAEMSNVQLTLQNDNLLAAKARADDKVRGLQAEVTRLGEEVVAISTTIGTSAPAKSGAAETATSASFVGPAVSPVKATFSTPTATVTRGKAAYSASTTTPIRPSQTPAKAWRQIMADDKNPSKGYFSPPAATPTKGKAMDGTPHQFTRRSLGAITLNSGRKLAAGGQTPPLAARLEVTKPAEKRTNFVAEGVPSITTRAVTSPVEKRTSLATRPVATEPAVSRSGLMAEGVSPLTPRVVTAAAVEKRASLAAPPVVTGPVVRRSSMVEEVPSINTRVVTGTVMKRAYAARAGRGGAPTSRVVKVPGSGDGGKVGAAPSGRVLRSTTRAATAAAAKKKKNEMDISAVSRAVPVGAASPAPPARSTRSTTRRPVQRTTGTTGRGAKSRGKFMSF